MKRGRILMRFGGAVLGMALLATTGLAQSSGTVTITGSIPEAFSLTNTSGALLSDTINLGILTPGTTNTITTGTSQIRVRSNRAYKVTGVASAFAFTAPGATDGGNDIGPGDIGIGIASVATGGNGANVFHPPAAHTVAALFNYDPAVPAVTNGLTPYVSGTHGTLADLSASTQLLNGPRISMRGNMTTNNNFLDVMFKVGTLPQYFTPNSGFSATVTLTISAF